MISHINYFINLINLFLIFIYFIFININLIKTEFEFLLISLVLINLFLKLYNWNFFDIEKKQNSNSIFSYIFFNDRFTRVTILIFSIAIPIYMIFQKDNLVIDLFVEKLSFLLVFIFSLIGFYLEFFILEGKFKK